MHPATAVSLLEDSALVGAELAVGILDISFAGFAKPGLCGARRHRAGDTHRLAHTVAAFVYSDFATITFNNFVRVIAAIAQTCTADRCRQELGGGAGMSFGQLEQLLGGVKRRAGTSFVQPTHVARFDIFLLFRFVVARIFVALAFVAVQVTFIRRSEVGVFVEILDLKRLIARCFSGIEFR